MALCKTAARGPGRPTLTYAEAVEEALCFGWIDGIRQRIDASYYSLRFTPRRPRSVWSLTNRKRVERLRGAGLMTPAGERMVEAAKTSGAWERAMETTPPELAAALADDAAARAGWDALPPSARRQYIAWVGMARRPDTRARRVGESLALLRRGQRLDAR